MKTIIYIFLITSFGFLSSQTRAQNYNVPEILYYKFDSVANTTPNLALPGQGAIMAPVVNMTMGPTGQFGNALIGNAGSGTNTYVSSEWNMNLGTSDWTLSLWINNFPAVTGTSYLFGNDITTSFRCFTNGAAGAGNITLRGNGITNTNVTGVLPGPSVVHFVYDSSVPEIRTYVNGSFQNSVLQTAFNFNATVPFKVGSYGTSTSIPVGALIDEFRFYSRALETAEISATWNQTLPYISTGLNSSINIANPDNFYLSQNYPNPFNPVTRIMYSIPTKSSVKLVLYDILNKEILTMVNETKPAGDYVYDFNGSDLSSGVYFYKLETEGFTDMKKMILLK